MGSEDLLQLSAKSSGRTAPNKGEVHKKKESNGNTSDYDSHRYDEFEGEAVGFIEE